MCTGSFVDRLLQLYTCAVARADLLSFAARVGGVPRDSGAVEHRWGFRQFMSTVARVVVTGGPCAGKTTAIPMIASAARAKGITVLTLPEMATMLVETIGVDRTSMVQVGLQRVGSAQQCDSCASQTDEGLRAFNLNYQHLQLAMEDRWGRSVCTLHTERSMRQDFCHGLGTTRARPSGDSATSPPLLVPDAPDAEGCRAQLQDRGMLDSKAYVPPALWSDIIGGSPSDSRQPLTATGDC